MMRLTMLRSTALALVLAIALPATAADRFDEVRTYINNGLKEQSVPSISVAVASHGKIIWEEGFGWADRERMLPADANTPYSLASISKPITATALMTLVRAGKLGLDTPANDYLGDAPLTAYVGNARDATVRRIANHTSGLPLHWQFFYADEPWHKPSMQETIRRYGILVNAPGEHSQYSNLGYGILDDIIGRTSGTDYADYMRQAVFLPLGMTRSSVDIGPGLQAYAATRYGEDGLPLPFYDFDHPGASAIFSSAHDLVRFGMFHLKDHLPEQKAILDDAAIDEMHRPTAGEKLAQGEGYGVGFSSSVKQGYRIVSHTGGMPGVSTSLWLVPERDLAMVVLSNASSSLPSGTMQRLAAAMLPGWKVTAPTPHSPPAAPVISTALQGTWKGTLHTYTGDVPATLRFLPGGQVHAQLGDQLEALVNELEIDGSHVGGLFAGRIGTPDTDHYHYNVQLDLTLRGSRLSGAATAIDEHTGYNEPRARNALSHWIELEKQP